MRGVWPWSSSPTPRARVRRALRSPSRYEPPRVACRPSSGAMRSLTISAAFRGKAGRGAPLRVSREAIVLAGLEPPRAFLVGGQPFAEKHRIEKAHIRRGMIRAIPGRLPVQGDGFRKCLEIARTRFPHGDQ